MFHRVKLNHLEDYFLPLSQRSAQAVYFCRLISYSKEVHTFLSRYYQDARTRGVVIEGKIGNPIESNLSYYYETMGKQFRLEERFINVSLSKWLPRLNRSQRDTISSSIYTTLLFLKESGKAEAALKNAYIKFMCWLYYKFERIVAYLGQENPPKILYEGNIPFHELLLLTVLSKAGSDILLLQYNGDTEYLKIDSHQHYSDSITITASCAFPEQFSLKKMRDELQLQSEKERLYGQAPSIQRNTNTWMTENILTSIRQAPPTRGDSGSFYNCFCRMSGVEDKLTYQPELYQLQRELKASGRAIIIENQKLPPPTPEEISAVRRAACNDIMQLLRSLAPNFRCSWNQTLQQIATKEFVDFMLEEYQSKQLTLQQLSNKAIYLICWFQRYSKKLFFHLQLPNVAVFLYLGGCQNQNEAFFLRFFARLPVDILILAPDLGHPCQLKDESLVEECYSDSLSVQHYPEQSASLTAGTVAFHAEQELDSILYQDTGMYRSQQYQSGEILTLQTMYEEISILWNQELPYRPNFSTLNQCVQIPVIAAKVCGIKNADVEAYWRDIKKLQTDSTFFVQSFPAIGSTSANPIKPYATEFLRNKKLQRNKILSHKCYQYNILRAEMQTYILDKLQLLIDSGTIRGTFQNGTEYTIISTALNLDKQILRLLQSFDFTKKNPKLIYLVTGDKLPSLEDTIQAVFLHLLGFDVLIFTPTGYQCIEQHLNKPIFAEYQLGEYKYDLQPPDWNGISTRPRQRFRDLFFGRSS